MPPGIRSGKTRKEATDFADFTDFTDGKTIWKSGRGEQPYFLTGLGRGGRWGESIANVEFRGGPGDTGGGQSFPQCGRKSSAHAGRTADRMRMGEEEGSISNIEYPLSNVQVG